MDELLKELEEDIKRDQAAQFWTKLGKVAIAASIFVVLATVVYVVHRDYRHDRETEQTSLIVRGVDRMNVQDYRGAIELFDQFASDTQSPYYPIAMLKKARAQTALGDAKAAQHTYETLATQQGAHPLSGIGTLLGASKDMPIEPQEGSPFYYSQLEWKAWRLLEQDQTKEAVMLFQTLASEEGVPVSQRGRASDVLSHLMPEGQGDVQ